MKVEKTRSVSTERSHAEAWERCDRITNPLKKWRLTVRQCLALVILILVPLLVGCGGDDRFASVEGTVTIDGTPVEGVEIIFDADFPGGSPSVGFTDANGYYRAMFTPTQPGAMVGPHRIRIRAEQIDGDGNVTTLAEIPPEYGDESEIEFEVTPGSNTFDLDVSTQASG